MGKHRAGSRTSTGSWVPACGPPAGDKDTRPFPGSSPCCRGAGWKSDGAGQSEFLTPVEGFHLPHPSGHGPHCLRFITQPSSVLSFELCNGSFGSRDVQ